MKLQNQERPYMMSFEGWAERELVHAGIKTAGGTDELCPRSLRLINKLLRIDAGEHAERAIRWYARVYFPANGPCSSYEYAAGLDHKVADIVNGRA